MTRADDDGTLNVSALYSGVRPYGNPYPIQATRIQVISPDGQTRYAAVEAPLDFNGALLSQQSVTLSLPADIPALTPALVYIQPRTDNAITVKPLIVPLTLNRPAPATLPADAQPADAQFGPAIRLRGYTARYAEGQLRLALYWEASAAPSGDYQVFVHVLNADSEQVGGGDSAPVGGRYPTSQWRLNALIADERLISFAKPLPPGAYRVWLGLYRLPDGVRLPIGSAQGTIQDDRLLVYRFEG
jgi:hypothetical protein